MRDINSEPVRDKSLYEVLWDFDILNHKTLPVGVAVMRVRPERHDHDMRKGARYVFKWIFKTDDTPGTGDTYSLEEFIPANLSLKPIEVEDLPLYMAHMKFTSLFEKILKKA